MLAGQRQEHILSTVIAQGGVRVSELVDRLGVSDMTVRRDIEALASRGLLARVHGGATALSARSTDEPGFMAKSTLALAQKAAIARTASSLVAPGAAVALSAGTTTYAVARELCTVPELTVVTNSVPVAQLLHETGRPDLTLVLTGGIRTPSDALVGPVALSALSGLHVDWLFLGVHGMDERAGLTTPNIVEGQTDQALMACAARVVVVADGSKWGVVGLSTIAPFEDVDVLVSDASLPDEARRAVEPRVARLLLAEHGPRVA